MRILFTCGREPTYPRNALLLKMLKQRYDVIEITETSQSLSLRYARVGWKLLTNHIPYDIAFVGFLGHPLMLLVPYIIKRPVIFDMFVSFYDTLCLDRAWISPRSIAGKLALWLDKTALRNSSKTLIDTRTHGNYIAKILDWPAQQFTPLFVGCDDSIFFPRNIPKVTAQYINVLYYSSYLPLHGTEIILRAANRLKSYPQIRFKFIGGGSQIRNAYQLAQKLHLTNVEFFPPVPLSGLPIEIATADICLGGHFSTIPKAANVIAGKTFQCLAMGKATIVGDNPANRELLTPQYDALFCPMGNEVALADAILTLAKDDQLRAYLGNNALQTFQEHASINALQPQLYHIIETISV